MKRFIDYLAGVMSGILIGVLMCAAIAPDAWAVVDPTPRPPQHADSGSLTPERTMDGVSPVPSPSAAAGTGLPDRGTRQPSPSPSQTASPKPTGTRPAATAKPRTSHSLRGAATWYSDRRGHAAAGPELRRALGAGWRGRTVSVCSGTRCVRVALTDWCACTTGNRLVDLDRRDFAVLASPSRGVIPVTVRW